MRCSRTFCGSGYVEPSGATSSRKTYYVPCEGDKRVSIFQFCGRRCCQSPNLPSRVTFQNMFSFYSQFQIFAISSLTETHKKTQKASYCLSKKKEEGNELTTCAITALLRRAKKRDVCRGVSAAEMNRQR